MAVYAEIEGIGRLEFPDGTDPAVIQRTVKNFVAQRSQAGVDQSTASTSEEPSLLGAATRAGIRSLLPTVAGFVGAGAGTVTEPGLGTILGGAAAATATSEAQKKFFESYPEVAKFLGQDPQTVAADIKAHPIATTLTDLGTSLIGQGWEAKSLKALAGIGEEAAVKAARQQALVGAGLVGGIDVGAQLGLNGPENFNPTEALGSAVLGAVAHKPTAFGETLQDIGQAGRKKVASMFGKTPSVETPSVETSVTEPEVTEEPFVKPPTPSRVMGDMSVVDYSKPQVSEPIEEPKPAIDPANLVNQYPEPPVTQQRAKLNRTNDSDRSFDEINQDMAEGEREKVDKQSWLNSLLNWGKDIKNGGYDELVRKFQTSARPLYRLQKTMEYFGQSIPGHNDIYNAASLNPSGIELHNVNALVDAQNKALEDYANKADISWDQALANVKGWMLGLNDPDLRKYQYATKVPLSTKPLVLESGLKISPADMRDNILQAIKTSKDLTSPDAIDKYGYDAKSLREQLDYLVQNFTDENGYSPDSKVTKSGNPTDYFDSVYDVSGPFSQKELKGFRDHLIDQSKDYGDSISNIFSTNQALRDKIIELDRSSNNWGQHVDNAVAFQNRSHYFTLKGNNIDDAISNPHLVPTVRKDLATIQKAQEGRTTESDNPFTQTAADAMVALNRIDKNPLLDSLYNNIKDGYIQGEILDPVNIGDRDTALEGYNTKNIVLRPRSDGKLDVMYINDPKMVEAVKGVISTQNSAMDALGGLTRFVTAGYTKYNPPFAITNSIRHFLTNLGNISSELGPQWAARMVAHATEGLATLSPFKAARVSNLLANNDVDTLKELASSGDTFYNNIYNWLATGGKITQNMMYSNDAATNNLVNSLNNNKGIYGWTKDGLNHLAEVWNNTFEFLNREAAFDTFKKQGMANGMDENQANFYASANAKNMLNLQQTAQYTKNMNSWFALFKAEATGAVRQTDALLSPLFNSAEDYFNKYVKGTPLEQKLGGIDSDAAEKFKDNYNKQRMNAAITAMAAVGAGYSMYHMARALGGNDADGENIVANDDKSRWVRSLRVPTTILGDKKDDVNKSVISVPWGFGTGALASIGAQLAALQHGDQTLPEAALNMSTAAKQSFLPIPAESMEMFNKNPTGWLVSSLAPSVSRPVLSLAMNLDDFGRQIHDTHVGKYGEAYMGGDYMPEIYKDASRYIFDKTNGKTDISPNELQFLANNYVQAMANVSQSLYGNYQNMRGLKELDVKQDLLPLSGLVSRVANAESRRFFETSDELDKMRIRLATLKNTNRDGYDKLLDDDPDLMPMINYYNRIKYQSNQILENMNKIRASDETPKEREEDLQDLRLMRNELMKDFNARYKEYKESK